MKAFGLFGYAALLLIAAGRDPLAAGLQTSSATIRCGSTIFVARTRFHSLSTMQQSILAFPAGKKSPVAVNLREARLFLPFDPHAFHQLASNVSAWQCRKTPIGQVLVLWYSCNLGIPGKEMDRYCTSTHEWERYVASSGNLLDPGYDLEDPRYDALRKRLGYPTKSDAAFDEGSFVQID